MLQYIDNRRQFLSLCVCMYYLFVWQILSFWKWKIKELFWMVHKAFLIANIFWKDSIVLFFSCLLKWIVIISFQLLFIFCIMLSVGTFFCSCLNKFLAFHISFNMDVFIVIINFRVLFSVFIAFKPKMFCIKLFSELGFSFFIIGSNMFHIFFLFLQL